MSQTYRMVALNVLLAAASGSAFAQIDLSGIWDNNRTEDFVERVPGPNSVDYLGLPLNEDGRALALSYNYSSRIGQPVSQCGYYPPFYVGLGPFGLKIWPEDDPVTGRVLAWKIGGWLDRATMTIWMDGRPHPSSSALHTDDGFTTGVWSGDTLTTYTTHFKEGLLRRNGAPSSDQASLTMHITRHGELLTITTRLEDPVYLTEPHVVSRVWRLNPRGTAGALTTCEPITEVPRLQTRGFVPHYLPNKNQWINEMTEIYHIPIEAVLGRAETNYPEYRKKLKETYRPPESCARYCCMLLGCQVGGDPKNPASLF